MKQIFTFILLVGTVFTLNAQISTNDIYLIGY